MNLNKLKEGMKIVVVSCDKDIFNKKNIYTDYLILRYRSSLYLKYCRVDFFAQVEVSYHKIIDISSIIKGKGTEIVIPNSVEVGTDLSGSYSDGYSFNIPSIISIKKSEISKDDLKDFKEVF